MMKWVIAGVLLIAVAGGVGFSVWRFNNQVAWETEALFSNNTATDEVITEEMVRDLPTPVKRWLQNSGIIGREAIKTVHLKQKGELRLKPDQEKWMKAESEQAFTIDHPGFIWRVKTTMAGMPVIGRDLFMNGQGSMEIRLAGFLPVVNVSHHEKINESTLQRYLGEIVWFPSAALSEYILWEPVDDHRAKATMTYGGTSGSAIFHFNDQGEVTRFVAYRYQDINDEAPTEWVASVNETSLVNGLSIPTRLEVSWILEEGSFTWYVFEIYDVVYNQSE